MPIHTSYFILDTSYYRHDVPPPQPSHSSPAALQADGAPGVPGRIIGCSVTAPPAATHSANSFGASGNSPPLFLGAGHASTGCPAGQHPLVGGNPQRLLRLSGE